MKPLLATKITKERQSVGDYEPAAHQATMDGLRAFEQRQRERMEAAQSVAKEKADKVRTLKGAQAMRKMNDV